MCLLFDRGGESRPLALATADHADTYKQLPVKREDEPAAVVTPKNPTNGMRRGPIPRTQLLGSAAAVLHYHCFSRATAPVARRILKIPCVEYYDDVG